MNESGELSVTLPRFAAEKHATELVNSSRQQIREWQQKYAKKSHVFEDNSKVGQSHIIKFSATDTSTIKATLKGLSILVEYPQTLFPSDPKVQKHLKAAVQKALQKEARAYLPRRLKYLADEHGFNYKSVRFGTQKGRWGSCSSKGTISLNVGLMLLEPPLIDYVIIHELSHTRHMNHSKAFWGEVEKYLPNYKELRRQIKQESPLI